MQPMFKKNKESVALLFVCCANICRSPVFAALIKHWALQEGISNRLLSDSCGLDTTFIGASPHLHMQEIAKTKGVALSGKARLLARKDLVEFDAIFGVTREIVEQIVLFTKSEEERKKIFLATSFSATHRDQDVPDPYYYDKRSSFEAVWEVIEEAAGGIFQHFKKKGKH